MFDKLLSEIKKNNYKIHILGAGSNTLIRDSGVKGVVIKLGSKFSDIKLLEKGTIEVGAAILDRKVSDFAKNNNIQYWIDDSTKKIFKTLPDNLKRAANLRKFNMYIDYRAQLKSFSKMYSLNPNEIKKMILSAKKQTIKFTSFKSFLKLNEILN